MVIKQTMKTKRRRRFSQDFRDDAVRMVVIEGMEIGEAAEKLGVGRSNLQSEASLSLDACSATISRHSASVDSGQ